MASLTCQLVRWLSTGAIGVTEPCVLFMRQKLRFQKQLVGKAQLASAFQASVCVLLADVAP